MLRLAQEIVAQISPSTVSSATTSVSVGPAKRSITDAAEQLPLGFGDKCDAGTDEHVIGCDLCSAQSHSPDCLNSTETINLVGAGQMHRRDDRGMRARAIRRARRPSGRDNALCPRHLGRLRHSCAPR